MGQFAASAEPTTQSVDQALSHAERLVLTDPIMAREQLDEILRVVGSHPREQLLRARLHARDGDVEAAESAILRLRADQPRWIPPFVDHAHLLVSADRLPEAEATLREAVQVEPRAPRVWLLLADVLRMQGKSDDAASALLQHVANAGHDPQLSSAGSALHENRLADAESLLRSRIKELPTDIAAIRMLAELAVRVGRNEDAESLLFRCLELAPGFAAARQNYAMVLHRSNKPEEALAQLDRLLSDHPDDPSHLNLRAVVLCRIGDYDEGISIYRRLLERHPDQGRIWLSYGHALKTAGEQDDAVAAYRRSLELDPGFGEAWWSLANLKTFRFEPADLDAMNRIDSARLDADQKSQLEFALGKAYEDLAEFERSFAYYRDGNETRKRLMPYRPDEATARVDRARQLFTKDFLDARAGWGCPERDPIFIVGMPRAGSTLVEQILSSHPQVEGTMELPEVISITRELRQQGANYHEALEVLEANAVRELGERYLERTRIQRKQGRPFFIDKMPNNFFHVGLIHLMLPNARIIDVRRHPMACCFSGYKQYFARGQNFSYGLQDIGSYYRDYVALMAHMDSVLPGRVHRIIYEQLVDDVETQVRALLDYCGLPFDEQCLRFFENDRAVRTASSEQVRKPIYRDGLDHWRNFEPWLEPLKGALGPVLENYPEPPSLAEPSM